MYNGEQGIWLEGANSAKIYNNYIAHNKARPGFGGGSSAIMLDFDIFNVEIWNNTIEGNDACGITMRGSHDNVINDNIIKGNRDPGICIWGEGYTLPTYHDIEARNNKIFNNVITNHGLGGILFIKGPSGGYEGTEIRSNIFDQTKEESIQSRDNHQWYQGVIPDGVIVDQNTFKIEDPILKEPEFYPEEEVQIEPEEEITDEPLEENEVSQDQSEEDKNPAPFFFMLFILTLIALIIMIFKYKKLKNDKATF